MATKKCPNCSSDCPVASSSCKKCLHVFKSRKGSSNSISSSSNIPSSTSSHSQSASIEDSGGTEYSGRRHTGRITRSKPNFYDSLHVEEQMRQEEQILSSPNKSLSPAQSCDQPRRLFVTVGTTKFEELVNKIQSEKFIRTCVDLGIQMVVVQTGESIVPEGHQTKGKLCLEFFKYKKDLSKDFQSADLVISHAGAGTVLDVLSLRKNLIVVPNPTLMNNHQDELADYVAKKEYALKSTLADLTDTLQYLVSERPKFCPLPIFDASTFDKFLKGVLRLDTREIQLLQSSTSSVAKRKPSQKLLLRKQLKQSKSEEDGSGASGGLDEGNSRDKDLVKTGEPEPKKRKRGRPPGITGKKPGNSGRITIQNKSPNIVKISNHNPTPAPSDLDKDLNPAEEEDIMADITPEKALQYNIVLEEINRKWVSANWKVS